MKIGVKWVEDEELEEGERRIMEGRRLGADDEWKKKGKGRKKSGKRKID